MISGVTVTVMTPSKTGEDRFGEPIMSMSETAVPNVLVAPAATADLQAQRPDGARVGLTLHFPKEFDRPLRGCSVRVPAPWSGTYRVIGDPKPYIDANTPTPWHMQVEVEAVNG